jgi:DNA-binding NarL/FixJ family response regulator
MEVVGQIETADGLVEEATRARADVVLLDIEMPGRDPFEALQDLGRRCPKVKVILLSAYVRDHYVDTAIKSGAWGYLSKSDSPDTVVDAIRKASGGEFVFGPKVLERVQPRLREDRPGAGSRLEGLTPTELQVLRMIARGLSRVEIALAMHRSPKTVDNHRAAMMEKLGIHTTVELARFAIREGLAEA